jgi:DNA-binding NarL/FixJ family response regulator
MSFSAEYFSTYWPMQRGEPASSLFVLSIEIVRRSMESPASQGARSIRVLMADDQGAARRGVRALLSTFDDIEVIGEAINGQQAMELTAEHHPDVVLMDVRMPEMDGVEATRQIKGRWPDVAVLILTLHPSTAEDSRAAGADAFLLKGCSTMELVGAIRTASGNARDRTLPGKPPAGRSYPHQEVTSKEKPPRTRSPVRGPRSLRPPGGGRDSSEITADVDDGAAGIGREPRRRSRQGGVLPWVPPLHRRSW